MRSGKRVLAVSVFTVMLAITVFCCCKEQVKAVEVDSFLKTLNAGAAVILDVDITMGEEELHKIVEAETIEAEEASREDTLVMANVQESLNIRKEADSDSAKVGLLYKDCGGEVLERENGWTKLQSGNLIGWAKDEYLLFGEEAKSLAGEVGNLIARVDTQTLRVRKEANENAEVYGLLAQGDEVMAIEENGDWVSIDFDGETGYIASQFVEVDFKIDFGETTEAIQEREQKFREEKALKEAENKKNAPETTGAQPVENRGAVAADISDATLLAALIQCESGGESYEGQVAVGAVVMNRLRSGAYPSTMQGVIYASGQFSPALNGKVMNVATKGPKASCVQAALEAINGISNVGGATHFKRAGSHDGIVIGNHVFW